MAEETTTKYNVLPEYQETYLKDLLSNASTLGGSGMMALKKHLSCTRSWFRCTKHWHRSAICTKYNERYCGGNAVSRFSV